jgi:hypothetical protein
VRLWILDSAMTYDQWKTTDLSQEGDVCPCGSGEWACRVYSKEYGVPPIWACVACEGTDEYFPTNQERPDDQSRNR